MSEHPPFWSIDWQADAACRGCDPDIWFPIRGRSGGEVHDAKRTCARCPVLEECRAWAHFYRERQGIWGGLTEAERRRQRRGLPEHDCPDCSINHIPKDPEQQTCHWCRRWNRKTVRKTA